MEPPQLRFAHVHRPTTGMFTPTPATWTVSRFLTLSDPNRQTLATAEVGCRGSARTTPAFDRRDRYIPVILQSVR